LQLETIVRHEEKQRTFESGSLEIKVLFHSVLVGSSLYCGRIMPKIILVLRSGLIYQSKIALM
jgi:hypothetical protein